MVHVKGVWKVWKPKSGKYGLHKTIALMWVKTKNTATYLFVIDSTFFHLFLRQNQFSLRGGNISVGHIARSSTLLKPCK